MTRHVHTHNVQMLWKILEQKIYTLRPLIYQKESIEAKDWSKTFDIWCDLTLTTVSHVSL